MNRDDKLIYEAKQKWLERVMASDLTPATKVFAFGVYKRAFGTKITSYPDTGQLVEDTGLSRSKFTDYRNALFEAGAMSGEKQRGPKGHLENYTYTLRLDWDGHLAPSGDNTLHPVGTALHPLGTHLAPTGCSNTTSNTSKKTTSKTTRALADAPAPSFDTKEQEDGEDTSNVFPLPLATTEGAPEVDEATRATLEKIRNRREKQGI